MSYKTLGKLVNIKGGKRLPKGAQLQSEPNSHPYIRVRDMGDKYIPEHGLEYVPDDVFPSISRYIVNTNDVIISIVGTIGLVSIIDERFDNASQTENCAKLSGLDYVDANYVYYFLNSSVGQQEIRQGTVGAVQAKLPLYSIEKIKVYWPARFEREKIVDQLATIDRKLGLNSQTNQTLEQMAQAIFKSWFVDFDPVRQNMKNKQQAKMNGEQPEADVQGSNNAAREREPEAAIDAHFLPKEIAALFPDKLVESELGLIPEGWEVGSLSDVAKYCSDRTSIDFVTLENYISTENMLADKMGVSDASKLPTTKMIAAYKTGDILISNIRPYFKKIWLAEGNGGRSNDVLGFESSIPNTDGYIMNLLYQDTFFEYMSRTSKGAKMPRGDKTAIMDWEIAVPPVEFREEYSVIVGKFYKLIQHNHSQNETLKSLRDTLLPKLLSGEIDLTAATDQLEPESEVAL